MMLTSFKSNTTGVTCGLRTANPSGARRVRVGRSLFFSVIFCSLFFVIFVSFFWSLYCLSLDLRASDYPFVIFKLFLMIHVIHPVLAYREISILLFNISKMLRYYPKGVFTILLIHDCNSLLTVNKICGW